MKLWNWLAILFWKWENIYLSEAVKVNNHIYFEKHKHSFQCEALWFNGDQYKKPANTVWLTGAWIGAVSMAISDSWGKSIQVKTPIRRHSTWQNLLSLFVKYTVITIYCMLFKMRLVMKNEQVWAKDWDQRELLINKSILTRN